MGTKKEYIEYVMDSIQGIGHLRYKKMFGEYMVYNDEKPALLVCDDTVFVKKIDELKDLFMSCDQGFPYQGAKEHYILDIDDKEQSKTLIKHILPYLKIPKRKIKDS
jgi:TfoX/Sxy family transcriptional regulator of competence genes